MAGFVGDGLTGDDPGDAVSRAAEGDSLAGETVAPSDALESL